MKHSLLVAFAFCMILAGSFLAPRAAFSQSTQAITGWAWSDTIGWISLNCSDLGTCSTVSYGLSMNGSGVISGYAWSENVGWISAQTADVTGCPSAPCTPQVSGSSVTGWLKVLSSSDPQNGAWDGWVSLDGVSYGLSAVGNAILDWAWGDTNLGWIDFSANYPCEQTYGYYCTDDTLHYKDLSCGIDTIAGTPQVCSYQCQSGACVPAPDPGGTITATPSLLVRGTTATITWSTDDAVSCTVSGNGDAWSGLSGSQTSSPVTATVTYTLSCTGLDDSTLEESVTIRAVPFWREL